uniref:Uncharacterized protein n=1 Tax=Rhizophora mucronata TaxID=61149 RepID=A0A2P2ND51_RHIMU
MSEPPLTIIQYLKALLIVRFIRIKS